MSIAMKERVGFSSYRIYTEIYIDATPEEVWEVLVDTESYKKWSEFMVDITGEIRDSEVIGVSFKLNPKSDKTISISHKISVDYGKKFLWSEKGPGGILDDHHFSIERQRDGRAKFIQSDFISGGLTCVLGWKLSAMYAEGYKKFNESLRNEVERRKN